MNTNIHMIDNDIMETDMLSNPADLKTASLLIVDDEASNLKLLERVLSMDGYTRIIATQDPREVLNLYQNNKIDLILLDLNMQIGRAHV